MSNLKKTAIVFTAIIFVIIAFLLLFRLFSHREIDDVSPGIYCEKEYLGKSDVLWVIPLFENRSIADNSSWCAYIKGLNKTLGLHGVYHTFDEFNYLRNKEYVERGISAFEKCFGYAPKLFKAPQLALSTKNKDLLIKMGFDVKARFNQNIHKVYHCSDGGGFFSNRFNDML